MNRTSTNMLSNLLMKLYGNSDEAIFFFDRQGKVLAMNSAAEEIIDKDVYEQMMAGSTGAICKACKGYTSSEEPLTCVSCYMANPDEDVSSFQVYFDTKGRGVIPYSGSIQTIDAETGTRVFMLRNLTRQFKTQEELNQKQMMKRVIKAQEDERKRLSRELHDSVAQEMLSSLVDLRVLKYMNIEEEVLKKVQQTEGSLMRLLDDIRHLSVELRPATLDDLGLAAAFRTHFKWLEKNYGLIVHFHPELETKRYEGEIETVVYRVCQEAVFNALKYAEVDEMVVRLYESEDLLHLIVMDEGRGFELKNTDPKGTGLGIYGMKERAELVDGHLHIRSEVGKGTVIQLEVPVDKGGNDD
ncbi:sensor histidine kinase [Sporosarcina luteola]|uniref:sensor histidine kinase n=1 Tax=Bacillales TaxID=1385 RepID=UPI002041A1AE|nr:MULTISPECIES: sensor histidine kinase [Bacillales]MCM3636315.1 sensor histidine kinase [Sporosarcina luteola]